MNTSRIARRVVSWVTSSSLALLITCQAQGAIVFNLDTNFHNSTQITHPTATVEDIGTDLVLLTMSSSGLDRSISKWFFNLMELDPDPIDSLVFTRVSDPEAGTIHIHTGRTQAENLKANGDVYFNIMFDFEPHSFGPGTVVEYSIRGAGLNAAAFAELSAPPSGNSRPAGFFSAAHIPGNGSPGDSGTWVGATTYTVLSESGNPTNVVAPEPASLAIWGLGICLALVGFMYRRRKPGSATSV